MIEHSASVTELFAALHKAQAQLTGVQRDSVNPHFRNRYASLEAVIEAAKKPLQENGLAFTQAPGQIVGDAVEITTMLMHTSGQWLRSTLHVPLARKDPQGVGSAITYGCRYALMATLGLPPVDDDAEAAVGRPANKSEPAQPAQQKPDGTADDYVNRAIEQIGVLKTERALMNWWATEKTNRDKYRLSPDSGAGRRLMEAFSNRRAELQSETLMAG